MMDCHVRKQAELCINFKTASKPLTNVQVDGKLPEAMEGFSIAVSRLDLRWQRNKLESIIKV